MKVTFILMNHNTGKIDFAQAIVKGNNPTDEAWETAFTQIKERIAPDSPDWMQDIQVIAVLKGFTKWVDAELLPEEWT